MFKAIGALLCFASLACATRACAADALKIGILNGASSFVTLIADAKGYLGEQGLGADFIVFDSGAKMIPSLATGALDIGIGAASSALYNGVGRGLRLKIVADAIRNAPGLGESVLVRSDLIDSGRVKSLADLKGMTVAITAFASSEAASLDRAMRSAGLTFDDVEKLYAGFPDHVVAFQNKAIAASLTGEPFATLAMRQGVARALMTVGDYYPNQETAVVMFGGRLLSGKDETGVRFLKAYLKAARDYIAAQKDGRLAGPGADDVARLLASRSSIKDVALLKAMRANGIDPNGDVNVAALEEDLGFFKAHGQIEGAATVADSVDLTFVHEAARALGAAAP